MTHTYFVDTQSEMLEIDDKIDNIGCYVSLNKINYKLLGSFDYLKNQIPITQNTETHSISFSSSKSGKVSIWEDSNNFRFLSFHMNYESH